MKKNILSFLLLSLIFSYSHTRALSFESCSSTYGIWAMDSYNGTCKCMSGYVFGTDMFGKKTCVSADSVCTDKYGYGATADIGGTSCKCRYGYVMQNTYSGTKCVDTSTACSDKYGYNARYNSLKDTCECRSGYIFGDDNKCTDADLYCSGKHGLYSEYDDLKESCVCKSGYTANSMGRCEEKQNNVYFLLKELDDLNDKAIVQSTYDYNDYLIEYNTGCYSIDRYEGSKVVINLGTDYDLDRWDKIVLQDDRETCDISDVDEVDNNYSLKKKDPTRTSYYSPTSYRTNYVPTVIPSTNSACPSNSNIKDGYCQCNSGYVYTGSSCILDTSKDEVTKVQYATTAMHEASELTNTSSTNVDVGKIVVYDNPIPTTLTIPGKLRACPSTSCDVKRYYAESANVQITATNGEWQQVNAKADDGSVISGWIHESVLDLSKISANTNNGSVSSTTQITSSSTTLDSSTINQKESLLKKALNFLKSFFN